MSAAEVALAWSGGKDSTMALAFLKEQPEVDVVALITTITSDFDRVSIHGVRRSVLEAQVAALGLPLFEARIPALASNDIYEAAFGLAIQETRSKHPAVQEVAFGDLFLTDVRLYRERMLPRYGCRATFPLWGQNTTLLARHFVTSGYRAVLTCVDTQQLDPDFAGREFDGRLLEELPVTVDPCGERGEFHTCVYAGPMFERALPLKIGSRIRRDERFEFCDVLL